MEKTSKKDERKGYNTPFLTAFDFYARLKTGGNQGKMAQLVGIHSSHISAYRSGDKRVSEEIMDALVRASGGEINRYYLLGMSEYMLMKNVSDDELLRLQGKIYDPDHDVKQKKTARSSIDKSTTDIIQLYADLIKDVEGLRQQLKEELAEVQQMKHEYITARDDFRKAITLLHPALKYETPNEQPCMAAETTKK